MGKLSLMHWLIVAAAILASQASAEVQPAETLTLACKGTTTFAGGDKDTISMGIIVNFTTRTVQFGSPGGYWLDYPVEITAANDAKIEFFGAIESGGSAVATIQGNIDRVTGDVEATSTRVLAKNKELQQQV